jgi:putative oxidoreductase
MASQALVTTVARVLLALMFILAGYPKLMNVAGTAGYIASVGLPLPSVLAVAAGVIELVAGIALLIGFQARWAGLVLALFTVVASLLFHNFWAMPAEQAGMQQLMFLKNMAVTGGLLYVFAFGAGAFSVDARRSAA